MYEVINKYPELFLLNYLLYYWYHNEQIFNWRIIMATLILRDTYRALEAEMKAIDKKKRETSLKILSLIHI